MSPLDRNIQIFVVDKNGFEINGADVRFCSDGNLLGSVISAKGRASIQLENPGAPITVRVEYQGEPQEAKLAEEQNSYKFTYDVSVREPFLRENFPALVGLLLLAVGVGLAFAVSPRNNFEKQIILILMSLGAGGIASVIPGFLNLRLTLGQKLAISAAGALAVFVIVFFNPPSIVDEATNGSGESVHPPPVAIPAPVEPPVPPAECKPIRLAALAFDTAFSSPHVGPRHEAGMDGLIGNQRSSGAGPDRVVFTFAGPERGDCTYVMTVGYATEVSRPLRVTLNETGASVERALAEETGGYGTVKAVSVGGSWRLKTGENHLAFATYGQGAMPHLSYITFSPLNLTNSM